MLSSPPMKLNSSLFDSVRSRKRGRRAHAAPNDASRPGNGEAAHETQCPQCQWPDCARSGGYKAPLPRKQSEQAQANGRPRHYRFCLEHVRIYNRSYNYFAGMTTAEVDAFRKASLTGLRPTWRMGKRGSWGRYSADEAFLRRIQDILARQGHGASSRAESHTRSHANSKTAGGGKTARGGAGGGGGGGGKRLLLPADMEALEILGFRGTGAIPPGVEIKARYKSLIKRLHPDANGHNNGKGGNGNGSNDKKTEAGGERLIRILRAHEHLRARAFF